MYRRRLFATLVACCLSWAAFALGGEKAKEKAKGKAKDPAFAVGVKSHADWIKRFEENRDPRILYLLTHRAGHARPTLAETQELMKDEETADSLLESLGIQKDYSEELKEKVSAWKDKYGKDALVVETPNYQILATQTDKILCWYVQFYQDKVFKYYQKWLPTEEKISGRFVIMIYPTHGDFLASGAPGFAGAYFSPKDRALVSFVEEQYRMDRKWIADTRISSFFHEGMHQYIGYFVPEAPPWLNEGLANFMEAMIVRSDKIEEYGNMSERFCTRFQEMTRGNAVKPLRQFVSQSYGEFYSSPDTSYPQAWAFMHFLINYKSPKGGKMPYKDIPMKMIACLRNCYGAEEATNQAFEGANLATMADELKEYIGGLKPQLRSSTYVQPKM
jgi:hypothetical protein